MLPQSLIAFTADPGALGGGALLQNYTTPSALDRYEVKQDHLTLTGFNPQFAGMLEFKMSLDVTGGTLNIVPEQLAMRLACIVCACIMPISGMKEAYESLLDTYKWHTQVVPIARLPEPRNLFVANAINETKAPPMVFDDD